MFNLVSIFGNALKSVASGVAHAAAEQFTADPALAQKAGAAMAAAIGNIHIPTVLGAVIDQVIPHAAITWTPDQMKAAELAAIAKEALTGDISASAMFAAGAAWAAGVAAQSITDGAVGATKPMTDVQTGNISGVVQ